MEEDDFDVHAYLDSLSEDPTNKKSYLDKLEICPPIYDVIDNFGKGEVDALEVREVLSKQGLPDVSVTANLCGIGRFDDSISHHPYALRLFLHNPL